MSYKSGLEEVSSCIWGAQFTGQKTARAAVAAGRLLGDATHGELEADQAAFSGCGTASAMQENSATGG